MRVPEDHKVKNYLITILIKNPNVDTEKGFFDFFVSTDSDPMETLRSDFDFSTYEIHIFSCKEITEKHSFMIPPTTTPFFNKNPVS